MNFLILSDEGLGLSPSEPPPEKVPGFGSPASPGPRRSQLHREADFFPAGPGGAWGRGRAELWPHAAFGPFSQLGPGEGAAGSQADSAPGKVPGPPGSQRLGSPSLIFWALST